jgi:diphthine-ammonia ligase
MKFVALFSGGKDSIYSILESIRYGHELVACVHLGAPDESSTEEESYMWQTAASEVVRTQVEDCLGVPLLLYQRKGTSVNTSLVYEDNSKADEVEDLYLALQQAQEQFGVQAVSSGAILSTYQRVRIEHVCSRLGLTSLSYLWRLLPQKELLQKMLGDGIEAVVVRAACPPGLVPRKHLNKTLRFLWDTGLLERLHERYQFHVCGEGGEYESLVIDSPLHKKKLVFDEVVIEETDDGVGNLRIHKCHAEEKGVDDIPILEQPIYIEK